MSSFCSAATLQQLERRFDAVDAAQQQLLEELRAVDSKLGNLSELAVDGCKPHVQIIREDLKEAASDDPQELPETSPPARQISLPALHNGVGSRKLLSSLVNTDGLTSIVSRSTAPVGGTADGYALNTAQISSLLGRGPSALTLPNVVEQCNSESPPLQRLPGCKADAQSNACSSPRSSARSSRRMSIASNESSPIGELPPLEIHPGWDQTPQRRSDSRVYTTDARQRGTAGKTATSKLEVGDLDTRWKAWNPDSISRTVFEVFSMVMLLYDAFVVPYTLAFDPGENLIFFLATWITRLFWTADLVLNAFTGFRDTDAKLVLNLGRTAKHYLSTWFLPDLALVTCDWMTTTATTAATTGHLWQKWMRVMRLIRGGRQLLRGWTLVEKAKLVVQNKSFHLLGDISLLMIVILWVNHVVCCGWYSIGRSIESSDTGTTWLTYTPEYSEGGQYYEYLTALHWSMTQMTPGSMEVTPKSSAERIYNVSILLLGLLMGSSLVATLTSMMTQYKLRIEGSSRKFMILHQFLNQQKVVPELAMAIKLQVKARSNEKVNLKAKDVDYLTFLSNSLQDSLWHARCMRHLVHHPLLNSLDLVDTYAMQIVCKSAIKALDFPAGDAVFEEGCLGDSMYFVAMGRFQYQPGHFSPEINLPDGDPRLTLKPEHWCGEPALWTVWTHLGSLEALTTAEVFALSGNLLLSTLVRFPVLFFAAADYCTNFHRHINEQGVVKSDLSYGIDISELISSLSADTRTRFATPVIQRLEGRGLSTLLSRSKLHHLKEEVKTGKSDVGLVGKEVVRNTFVVALRLKFMSGEESRFLVKMGEVRREGHQLVPSCVLPGVKRNWRESYITAVNRLIQSDLGELASSVEPHFLEGSEQAVYMQASPTYGIRTRYLRTTFTATLQDTAKQRVVDLKRKPIRPPPTSCVDWMLRPEKRKKAGMLKEVAALLSEQKQAVVVHCDRANRALRKIYLWLTPREFEVLSAERAKPIIEQWLGLMPEMSCEEAVVQQTSLVNVIKVGSLLSTTSETRESSQDDEEVGFTL